MNSKWIVQNIDKWHESTERTQNIEFDDNIWIFIFLYTPPAHFR